MSISIRDEQYIKILRFGLNRLRSLCAASRCDEAFAEADHLHNIPSLLGEENDLRHAYYLVTECEQYKKSFEDNHTDASENAFDHVERVYEPCWKSIRESLMRGVVECVQQSDKI